MRVKVERVGIEDIAEINRIQKLAFKESFEKYQFCPAFEATDEHIFTLLEKADAYKIIANEKIVGSIFIYKISDHQYELDTVSILPEYQNKGIGSDVINLIESLYPDAICWTLQTPEADHRNRHLYEKHGYLQEDLTEINKNLVLIQYRKQCKETL